MSDINTQYYFAMSDVLLLSVKNESSYNALKSLRIDYSCWPTSDIKNAITTFDGAMRNGYEAARAVTYAKHTGLIKELKSSAAKETIASPLLLDALNQGHQRWWADQFVDGIKNNPASIDSLINSYQKNKPRDSEIFNLKEDITYLINEKNKRAEDGTSIVTLPDYPMLSQMVQGFNPSQISLLTALSGAGKTTFCVGLAQSAVKIMDVLFINMEMDRYEFGSRFVYSGAGIESTKWRGGKELSNGELEQVKKYEANLKQQKNLFYSGGKAMTLEQIKTEIYTRFNGDTLGLVIIDYDQKIVIKSRDDEWRYLLTALTELEEVAKATKTHIIVVSQADESGFAKASKRMTQPCTNVLNFYKDGAAPFTRYFVRQLKARYSTDQVLELNANMSMSRITEKGMVNPQQATTRARL